MDGAGVLFALVEDGEVTREHVGDAVVPWWSFTKTLIATGVMRLVELGEIDLDETVADRGFTIRQALRHEAGLADYGTAPDYFRAVAAGDPAWPVDKLLERVGPPIFEPGRGWAYSNIGYLWLRELLEQRHGPDALAELVLAPLGAVRARLARTPDDLDGVMMGSATGYDPAWVYHGLVVGPAREAALTLDRLAAGRLVSPTSLAEMRVSRSLPRAVRPPWRTASYGLGVMTPELGDGTPVFGHTGGGPGSGIAVYRSDRWGRTVATFALDEASMAVEGPAAALLLAP